MGREGGVEGEWKERGIWREREREREKEKREIERERERERG